MKKIFTLVILLSAVLSLQAENLPLAGGWDYSIKDLSGELKVSFTKQYGDMGLCDKLPINVSNYKGVRVEFAAPVSNQIQLKITGNGGTQYFPAEEGATQISVNLSEKFGSGDITELNIQANTAPESCLLKNVYLIKADNTEEVCNYDTSVGYNKEVEVYSANVEFKKQWAQLGNWSGSAGDTYTITFGSAVPDQTFQWKYTDGEGDHYVEIASGTTATITLTSSYTGLYLQLKANSYTVNIVSITRNHDSSGEGGGEGGGEELPEGALPISIIQDASIDVTLPVSVTFTKQYGDLGLCKALPVSINDYKGFRVEFAEGVVSNLQLKVENGSTTKYIPAAEDAKEIFIDFTEQFGTGNVTVINLQDGGTGHSCTITKAVLIKQNGEEVPSEIDTAVGYNKVIEAYSGNVTFLKQYAKIGGWENSDANADDTYTVTFKETVPAETFQWVYKDSNTHYPEIKEATNVMSLNIKGAYSDCALQYKASGQQTYFIKSIVLNKAITTGISSMETLRNDFGAWYTLEGIRVAHPTKGVFIQNGKKVVKK